MKKYNVIYADPPWSYSVTKQTIPSRSSVKPYVPMRYVDILEIPVHKVIDDDCVLFLWATMPMLPEALHLIKAWGFEYKTVAFTWVKKAKTKEGWFWGMGSWTRSNGELCLLATKGNPKSVSHSVHSVIDSPVAKHSKKPDETRDRIVTLCGDVNRLEMFSRDKTDGWDVWGNELDNDIEL